MTQAGEKIGFLAIILTTLSLGTSPHPFALILCYVIHEAGHIVFAHIMGADMMGLRVGGCRLCLSYDCSKLPYKKELLVQAGGILFNIASAAIVWLLPGLSGDVCDFFTLASISLGLMNLLPITILDGGGIVKNLLLMRFSQQAAEKASLYISFACALCMWLFSVYLQIIFSANLSLFIISVFLLVELCFSVANA